MKNRKSEFKPQVLIPRQKKISLKPMPTNCSLVCFRYILFLILSSNRASVWRFKIYIKCSFWSLSTHLLCLFIRCAFDRLFVRSFWLLLLLRWARLFNELLLTSNWIKDIYANAVSKRDSWTKKFGILQ